MNPPIVIPYTAALITGRRAVVYLELPEMPRGVDIAFQGIKEAVEAGTVETIRSAFTTFSKVLDKPYDQPATDHAHKLWNRYADLLAKPVLEGKRVESKEEARQVFNRLEKIVTDLRDDFGPLGQPTFEGREIVLGPRAGNYYLVKYGLEEGQLVVTRGNFKIDAEIQIQAKPSMMTPEGGGGGGHDHGGGSKKKKTSGDKHAGHKMALAPEFKNQIRDLDTVYKQIAEAVQQEDASKVMAGFAQFEQKLDAVDRSLLVGHARMQWKEFNMLLKNDAVIGREIKQMAEADRLFLRLKGHMRRMREQLGVKPDERRQIAHLVATPQFQSELNAVWQGYLTIQQALAADDFQKARQGLTGFESSVTSVNDSSLNEHAKKVWQKEKTNLSVLINGLKSAKEIKAMRSEFKPLSEEIGVLAKSFGFGKASPVYEVHCPMAFKNLGAFWYQDNDQVRNPYFGSVMLTCMDSIEKIGREKSATPTGDKSQQDHSQH